WLSGGYCGKRCASSSAMSAIASAVSGRSAVITVGISHLILDAWGFSCASLLPCKAPAASPGRAIRSPECLHCEKLTIAHRHQARREMLVRLDQGDKRRHLLHMRGSVIHHE